VSPAAETKQEEQALIMVVDDNQEFLSGIELTLQMEGYQVWTAVNGQDALKKLKAAFLNDGAPATPKSRLPDLILVDIMMPEMDGYELYDEMRANPYLNHIPFVFLTAKSNEVDVRHGKELGADDYLTKLASTEDILSTVRGKLKRVEQQRSLTAQFTGDLSRPLEGSRLLLLAVFIALPLLGCVVGLLIATVLLR
jgi:CheY-like chemotaxis protein